MPDKPADKTPKKRPARPKQTKAGSEQTNSPTAQRTRKRRQGQHPLPEERNEAQETFLAYFAKGGIILRAAEAAGIDRSTVYHWRDTDKAFRQRYEKAYEDSNDVLLAAAWERATYGVTKPVVGGGHIIYEETPLIQDGKLVTDQNGKPVMVPIRPLTVQEYSDTLMALLLKARRPEFKEKQQLELTGKDGGALTIKLAQKMANKAEDEVATYRKKRGLPPSQSEEHLA